MLRRNEVLAKMAELGYISTARAARAEAGGLQLDRSSGYFEHRQPYFFDYVENKLIEKYGANLVRKGGLKVYTTIDPGSRKSAWKRCTRPCPTPTNPASALVSIDPAKRRNQSDGHQHQLQRKTSSTSPHRDTASPARPSRLSC